MRAILLTVLSSLITITGLGQKPANITEIRNIFDEKGDYYFEKKEFKKAIVYYNMAFQNDAKNYYSVLRKAEAYAAQDLYDQAAESYKIIFESGLYVPNEYRLHFALLLLNNKDITGFEKWMTKYNEIVHEEIHGYLSSQEVRAKMYKDTSFILVENEAVLNTPESEIGPAVYKGNVVFASNRGNIAGLGSRKDYNLFVASYLSGGQLGRLDNYNTNLNSSKDECAISFVDKTQDIYVSRGSTFMKNLQTYTGRIPASGSVKPDLTSLRLEGMNSLGQPTFSTDGSKMYFVSDASGGLGGLDLYTSKWIGGKWSEPVNLGARINSSKDEMYPFILHDSLLYFTSSGHDGLGGLDLFVVNLNRENPMPKNLGSQVNSEYDDFALAFSSTGLTGYFCSNRPGGFGEEDIYRLHIMDIKVKLAAYKFRRKPPIEEGKINLYLSDGEEYNITSDDKSGFSFEFQPEEAYKMVIRHENPLATDIMYDTKLTEAERKKKFLYPAPIEKSEIRLQPGMRYQFTAGMKPISNNYKAALKELSEEYTGDNSSTIDLTALAKELFLREGEVYTIRFVKVDDELMEAKGKEETLLFVNDASVELTGQSFFIMLPLDIQANFNIKTDIAYLKDHFNPKKTGAVKVDAAPVLKEEPVKESEGFPILVNTDSFDEVIKGREIKAKELTIIPGSMYVLSFKKTDAPEDDPGVVVPLTKGVKYNLGTAGQSKAEYTQALSQMAAATADPNEELIDISVLSKELDVASDRDIVFNLMPAGQYGLQASQQGRRILTTLAVDGRKYYITSMQRLQVNLKLEQNNKVNIQTDLAYVKENFKPSIIAVRIDTTSVNRDLEQRRKKVITDPVFDVIVVNFDLNEYTIRPDAKTILSEKVVQVLKGDSRLYVTIKGYTDPIGDADYNEKLSRNRAQTVKDFLISNGIGDTRIRTFSYGETLALQPGQNWEDMTEDELKKHRKVEIVIYLPK